MASGGIWPGYYWISASMAGLLPWVRADEVHANFSKEKSEVSMESAQSKPVLMTPEH